MKKSEVHQCQTSDLNKACVSLVPIFNHLEKQQLAEIATTTQSMSYKKGELIYRAGDQADSLYIISKGKVRIYRLADSGKEQLVRFLYPGDFVGESALFSESIHESYAEAALDTKICVIRRSDFQQILLSYPSISLKVLAEFSNRLEASEKQAARFSTEKVETRIAMYLVKSVQDENLEKSAFTLPMSKKDLASYLGTTPETISRKFNDLEEKGYIKQVSHKTIEIIDLDGLLLI